MKKYIIGYGFGEPAEFYTDSENVEERFTTLACTCFGIRKSILWIRVCEVLEDDREDKRYEELSFCGDRYIWREDGARKMLEPLQDEEWDTYYCERCER